jgi:CheY-like chemotaxis protein
MPTTILPWALAVASFALAVLGGLELRRRRELVVRACHELRGPLTAVRLSLATMERRREAPPERLATARHELRRAGLALDDFGLPDGSGFDLLRRVRSADGVASRINPDMPLIVISGRATELDRVRGSDRGADDYVCKPFSYPELRGGQFPPSEATRFPLRTHRFRAFGRRRPTTAVGERTSSGGAEGTTRRSGLWSVWRADRRIVLQRRGAVASSPAPPAFGTPAEGFLVYEHLREILTWLLGRVRGLMPSLWAFHRFSRSGWVRTSLVRRDLHETPCGTTSSRGRSRTRR